MSPAHAALSLPLAFAAVALIGQIWTRRRENHHHRRPPSMPRRTKAESQFSPEGFTYHFIACGEVVEVDLAIFSIAAWKADPRSKLIEWASAKASIGRQKLVIAMRLNVPAGSTRKLMDSYAKFNRDCVARERRGEGLPWRQRGKRRTP
jgi:hypothetical protein